MKVKINKVCERWMRVVYTNCYLCHKRFNLMDLIYDIETYNKNFYVCEKCKDFIKLILDCNKDKLHLKFTKK